MLNKLNNSNNLIAKGMKKQNSRLTEQEFNKKVELFWNKMVIPQFPNFKLPKIVYSKAKSFLAQATCSGNELEIRLTFTNQLLDGRYQMSDIDDTIKHEIGHLLAYKIYGKSQGHNANFKALGRKHGFNDKSSVKMKETVEYAKIKKEELKENKYIVTCPSCNKSWGKNRSQKLTKNPENYICCVCKHKGMECKQNY